MKLCGLVPNSYIHVSVSDLYIPRISLIGCSKIGSPILRINKSLADTWVCKLGNRTLWFCFGNKEATQFHFWEYINQNQTFTAYWILTGPSFAVLSTVYVISLTVWIGFLAPSASNCSQPLDWGSVSGYFYGYTLPHHCSTHRSVLIFLTF